MPFGWGRQQQNGTLVRGPIIRWLYGLPVNQHAVVIMYTFWLIMLNNCQVAGLMLVWVDMGSALFDEVIVNSSTIISICQVSLG